MARAANSPVFGPSATVLKQSASNFFSDDVTRAATLSSPKIFVFCKVSLSNKEYFLLLFSPFYCSANVPFHLIPRKSVKHVRKQSKQPTFSFIVCGRGFGLGQVFPSFLRPCTPSGFRYMSMFP